MNAATGASILLVEDDVRLAELVRGYLEKHGFRMTVVCRGDLVVAAVERSCPDLVILDLGLPGDDGFAVCRKLRPSYTNPILILTARDDAIDHVLGLELGADDFVVKPIEPRVLVARVGALLRRSLARDHGSPTLLTFGQLVINLPARSVTRAGRSIALSRTDFDLLALLAKHAGSIQSREVLFRSLYGREYDGTDRLLDIRVSQLRRKLGEDAVGSERLKTIWGKGYLFVADGW